MRLSIVLLAAGALLFHGEAAAETLGEATRAAMEHSPVLAAERERLEAVREELPIAWAEVFPQITGDATAIDSRSTERSFSLSVRGQREHWIASVRTSTLLYGGGRAWASRRQARARIAEAVARYQDSMQSFILDVTRAYGDVRRERATREAQEQAVTNFTQQQRFVDSNVRNGFLTQTDLAQADARLANARAELALANARLVAANEAYTRLVGYDPGALDAPRLLTGLPADLASALETATQESPSIVAQKAAYEASDAAVALAAAGGRLSISLETSDATLGMFDAPANRDQEQEDSISLRVAVPIFSGGRDRARLRQQRHLRAAEVYELDEARRRVRERVTVAWANLSAARARLEATRTRVEAAELASRGVLREQEFGQRSTIDVLDQENELLQARISLAQAEREAMVAERELAGSVGDVEILAGQAEGD